MCTGPMSWMSKGGTGPLFLFEVNGKQVAHHCKAHEVFDDLGHLMSPNVTRGVTAKFARIT